jgi:hypothetical protein
VAHAAATGRGSRYRDSMTDREARILTLAQPSSRRRQWELREGKSVLAVLRVPALRSGASAEAQNRSLGIERRGRLRADYVVRDETTGEEVAHLRREGRRRLLELRGWMAEWRHLGRKEGFGFVGPDGEPVVVAQVRSGAVRSTGTVRIAAGLDEQEATVAALLASYLLIRRNEQAASASAGAAVNTT